MTVKLQTSQLLRAVSKQLDQMQALRMYGLAGACDGTVARSVSEPEEEIEQLDRHLPTPRTPRGSPRTSQSSELLRRETPRYERQDLGRRIGDMEVSIRASTHAVQQLQVQISDMQQQLQLETKGMVKQVPDMPIKDIESGHSVTMAPSPRTLPKVWLRPSTTLQPAQASLERALSPRDPQPSLMAAANAVANCAGKVAQLMSPRPGTPRQVDPSMESLQVQVVRPSGFFTSISQSASVQRCATIEEEIVHQRPWQRGSDSILSEIPRERPMSRTALEPFMKAPNESKVAPPKANTALPKELGSFESDKQLATGQHANKNHSAARDQQQRGASQKPHAYAGTTHHNSGTLAHGAQG